MIYTRGRYALRVMIDLAEQNPEKYIPLEEIAMRQGISKKYLEAVLKVLVQHELLKGTRGKGGGYKLTREPAEYTVGEILELADEGSLSIVPCLQGENTCERKSQCLTLPIWEEFNEITREFFFKITLEDVLKKSAKK